MKSTLLIFIIFISRTLMANDALPFYQVNGAKTYEQEKIYIEGIKNSYQVATHFYSNGNSELVYFSHGYLDNCGYTKPYIRLFLENGYDVFCSELPGHGLSTGSRGDIDDFNSYKGVVHEVLRFLPSHYSKYHFVGHSTGNFGMMTYLLDGNKNPFDNIIMAAPLVRSYLWDLSRLGINLFGRFIKKLPRRDVIGDIPEYLELKKLDPAYIEKVPTHWAKELMDWNKNYSYQSQSSDVPIKLIFANKDTVIDWKYNRKFFQDHFPNNSIYVIKGSGHILHYEIETIKTEFFRELLSSLKK